RARVWVSAEFLYSAPRCEALRMIRESLELCDNILLVGPARLPTRYGPFRIYAFQCPFTGEDHVALVKGQIARREDVLVRLHSECVTGDEIGRASCRERVWISVDGVRVINNK